MVEAMGGQGSTYYVQFRMYACEAYNILRKSSDLMLSLFHLMAGSSIDAIRQDPGTAILKLQVRVGACARCVTQLHMYVIRRTWTADP